MSNNSSVPAPEINGTGRIVNPGEFFISPDQYPTQEGEDLPTVGEKLTIKGSVPRFPQMALINDCWTFCQSYDGTFEIFEINDTQIWLRPCGS